MAQDWPVAHLALSVHAKARDETHLADRPVLNTAPCQAISPASKILAETGAVEIEGSQTN